MGYLKAKVRIFTNAHLPHNQNSSIYILACKKRNQFCLD